MPHDYLDEQRQTIEFVKNTRANFNVSWIDVPCERGTNEYYSMLRDYWGFDDLLLLEMDIVPTYKQLTDIENCPFGCCTFNYTIPTGKDGRYIHICRNTHSGYRELPDSSGYCDTSGMGFTRLSLKMQSEIPILDVLARCSNKVINFDTVLGEFTFNHGYSFHIHGTVKHNHTTNESARWTEG